MLAFRGSPADFERLNFAMEARFGKTKILTNAGTACGTERGDLHSEG
jgi:hypothetical protein